MLVTKDVYSFNLFRDGTSLEEVLRDSSRAYFNKLRKNGLIRTDNLGKVYLTDKGQTAKKIGVERYIELEKFEKEIMNDNNSYTRLLNKYSMLLIFLLNVILAVVLAHVILITSSV